MFGTAGGGLFGLDNEMILILLLLFLFAGDFFGNDIGLNGMDECLLIFVVCLVLKGMRRDVIHE